MKLLHIFRPGRHVAASGDQIEFTEADVKATVDAYDPTVHEAPVVVGHPKTDSPAYGWIKALSLSEDGQIVAEPHQLMKEFEDAVQAGRWKKRSASFYHPDAPTNPKPGVWYLKHVGFLGGQPPAVKGMPDPAFSESHPAEEAGVVEFTDPGMLARLFRGLREYIVQRDGTDAADKAVPDFMIEDLTQEAADANAQAAANPAHMAEWHAGNPSEDDPMDTDKEARLKKLEEQAASFSERETTLKDKETNLSEREQKIADRERAIAETEVRGRVEALVAGGKVLPANKERTIAFAMALDAATADVDFGEGEAAEKITRREEYLKMLEAQPKLVDFDEHATDTRASGKGGSGSVSLSEAEHATRARAYVERMRQQGVDVTFTEAYDVVAQGRDTSAA